jgi:hypothetical protein
MRAMIEPVDPRTARLEDRGDVGIVASSTNAGRTIPRATPDWFVITTTAKPARFSIRTASTL